MTRPGFPLLFLLGAWAAGTVFMWQVAIQNFGVAEAVAGARSEGLAAAMEGVSGDGLRLALRYQASEVNRLFFAGWGWIQIPVAVAVLLLARAARCGRAATWLAAGMLAVSVLLAIYVVPETVRLGRMIDFAADGSLAQARGRFWTLHHAYTGLDTVKLASCLAVAGLAWRTAAGRRAGS